MSHPRLRCFTEILRSIICTGLVSWALMACGSSNGTGVVGEKIETSVEEREMSGPPAKPSHFFGVALDNQQIRLSWDDNSNDEENFVLQRKNDPGPYTTISTLPSDTISHLDTDVTPNTTYFYRVAATNSHSDSEPENWEWEEISQGVQIGEPSSPPPPPPPPGIMPIHDGVLKSYKDGSFVVDDMSAYLSCGRGTDPEMKAYLRFDLSGETVTPDDHLFFYIQRSGSNGADGQFPPVLIKKIPDYGTTIDPEDWTLDGPTIQISDPMQDSYKVEVTPLITPGQINAFQLTIDGSQRRYHYYASEYADINYRPRLELE